MQNELIVLEFERSDGLEPLATPGLPLRVSEALGPALQALLNDELGSRHQMMASSELLLAAADRGSLRLAFRWLIHRADADVALRGRLALASDFTSTLVNVGSIFVAIGIYTGFLKPTPDLSPERHQLVLTAGEGALSKKPVVDALERIIIAAKSDGFDRVVIHLPDQPTCRLVDDGSSSPEALGTLSREIPMVPHDEALRLVFEGNSVELDLAGEKRRYPVARLDLPHGSFSVIVDWKSKRSVPAREASVLVKADVIPIREAGVRPMGRVDNQLRELSALVAVRAQVIEE